MNIIWTKHGEKRQQQWQQMRSDITRQEVETAVNYPKQKFIASQINSL